MKALYIVYCHTNLINGKKYFGITMNPEQRWQNGRGYAKQRFGKAIKKYDWKNFKHEICFSGLSKSEAEKKEIELIKLHKTNEPLYGYNISDNEGGGRPSIYGSPEEAEEANRKKQKGRNKKTAKKETKIK